MSSNTLSAADRPSNHFREMRTALAFVLLALALGLCGCTPGIGSSCVQSTDCSPTGQLLCDTSQPGGYCTVFNCQPDRCPNNAACVITNIAPLGCPYDDRHSPSRFSRVLCLETCNQDSDCRQYYACVVPSDYGLLVIDILQSEKVCLPMTSYGVEDASADSAVCSVSGPTVPGFDAGPGYQGDAGEGSDAAGDGGDAGAPDASDAATD
jgi:hypothetical protein